MTPLRERLERKIESEATKRSLRQCSTGQDDLNKAISWYLKVGFEDGANSLLPMVMDLVEALEFYASIDVNEPSAALAVDKFGMARKALEAIGKFLGDEK